MKQQLTAAEAAFAAEKYGILQDYLTENSLPEDEYYDVVVFGFLKSVQQYHRIDSLKSFGFELLAVRAMDECLKNYLKLKSLEENTMNIVNISDIYEDSIFFERQISEANDTAKTALDNICIQKLLSSLSRTEYSVASLLLEGYAAFEIADILSLSLNRIENCIKCIREKAKEHACFAAA